MRLDATPRSVCKDSEGAGPSGGGPVCLSVDSPASSLHQLETRPGCRGNRCLHSGLELFQGLCQPILVSSAGHACQDKASKGPSSPCGSGMEDSAMVPSGSGAVDRIPSAASSGAVDSDLSSAEGIHNARGSAPTSHMAIVRQKCRTAGLSEAASKLFRAL